MIKKFETMEHNTTTPDVETASDGYASRFQGSVGEYLLAVQTEAVTELVRWPNGSTPLRVLDVGGGHGQLTSLFLDRGCEVWVQGSSPVCQARISPFMERYRGRLHFVASDLWHLPFPNRKFDLVVAIRLLAHVEDWQQLLGEMARVCEGQLLVDYAPIASANILEPILFHAKRLIEKNTRPYFCYSGRSIRRCLGRLNFGNFNERKEFFAPMVVHRSLKKPALSRRLEIGFSGLGLTALLGGPVLLSASRANRGEP